MIKLRHPLNITKKIANQKTKVGLTDEEIKNVMDYIKDIHSDKLCDEHIRLTYVLYTDGLFSYDDYIEDVVMYSDDFDNNIIDCLNKKDFVYIFTNIIGIDKKLLQKAIKKNPQTPNDKALINTLKSFTKPTDFFTFFGGDAFNIPNDPSGWYHSNMIIINSKLKTAEHFEPHGAILFDVSGMEHVLREKFARDFGITYYKMTDICPRITGFQKLVVNDPGFCTTWSIWFLDMRLLNLHVDRAKLYEGLITKLSTLSQDEIMSFISKYWIALRKYKKLRANGYSREESMQQMYKGKSRAYYELEVFVPASSRTSKSSSLTQLVQNRDDDDDYDKPISDVDLKDYDKTISDDDKTISDVDRDDDKTISDDDKTISDVDLKDYEYNDDKTISDVDLIEYGEETGDKKRTKFNFF